MPFLENTGFCPTCASDTTFVAAESYIVSGIQGVRLAGYMERGWADNHDVVMITKNDRLKRWW